MLTPRCKNNPAQVEPRVLRVGGLLLPMGAFNAPGSGGGGGGGNGGGGGQWQRRRSIDIGELSALLATSSSDNLAASADTAAEKLGVPSFSATSSPNDLAGKVLRMGFLGQYMSTNPVASSVESGMKKVPRDMRPPLSFLPEPTPAEAVTDAGRKPRRGQKRDAFGASASEGGRTPAQSGDEPGWCPPAATCPAAAPGFEKLKPSGAAAAIYSTWPSLLFYTITKVFIVAWKLTVSAQAGLNRTWHPRTDMHPTRGPLEHLLPAPTPPTPTPLAVLAAARSRDYRRRRRGNHDAAAHLPDPPQVLHGAAH